MNDYEHLLVVQYHFFHFKVKFTELERMRQYQGEDLDSYVKRSHKKALLCFDLGGEEVLVYVCLHCMMEKNQIFLENLPFFFRFQVNGT